MKKLAIILPIVFVVLACAGAFSYYQFVQIPKEIKKQVKEVSLAYDEYNQIIEKELETKLNDLEESKKKMENAGNINALKETTEEKTGSSSGFGTLPSTSIETEGNLSKLKTTLAKLKDRSGELDTAIKKLNLSQTAQYKTYLMNYKKDTESVIKEMKAGIELYEQFVKIMKSFEELNLKSLYNSSEEASAKDLLAKIKEVSKKIKSIQDQSKSLKFQDIGSLKEQVSLFSDSMSLVLQTVDIMIGAIENLDQKKAIEGRESFAKTIKDLTDKANRLTIKELERVENQKEVIKKSQKRITNEYESLRVQYNF